MSYDMYCTPEAPRKIEWAGVDTSAQDSTRPLRVKTDGSNRNQVLLSLPRFKSLDILDLIRLAEEKAKCRVTDRCSAIAILVGNKPLDSVEFLAPLVLESAPGTPKYLLNL